MNSLDSLNSSELPFRILQLDSIVINRYYQIKEIEYAKQTKYGVRVMLTIETDDEEKPDFAIFLSKSYTTPSKMRQLEESFEMNSEIHSLHIILESITFNQENFRIPHYKFEMRKPSDPKDKIKKMKSGKKAK